MLFFRIISYLYFTKIQIATTSIISSAAFFKKHYILFSIMPNILEAEITRNGKSTILTPRCSSWTMMCLITCKDFFCLLRPCSFTMSTTATLVSGVLWRLLSTADWPSILIIWMPAIFIQMIFIQVLKCLLCANVCAHFNSSTFSRICKLIVRINYKASSPNF